MIIYSYINLYLKGLHYALVVLPVMLYISVLHVHVCTCMRSRATKPISFEKSFLFYSMFKIIYQKETVPRNIQAMMF